MMDAQPVAERGILGHLTNARVNIVVNEMQFLRRRETEDLACELTVKRADLRDDSAFRQAFEKNTSFRHNDAPSKVLLRELGSRVQQTLP